MKKRFINTLMAMGIGLSMAQAMAGEGAGNGGGAWVCQNQDQLKTIRWARLVDLYEAEKEFLLELKTFGDRNFQEIVDIQKFRLFSIDKNLYEALIPHFDDVEASIRKVDVDLEVIEDSLYRVRPPARACAKGDVNYIQLANYTNYGAVLINQYLFNNPSLPEVDKAALIFHEVIYAYLRDRYGDTDSVRAREIVGYLFSDLKNVEISDKIEEILGHVRGTTAGMEFVTIPAGSFVMGSPEDELGRLYDEEQRHVKITYDFQMMTTEVTQAMYFEVTGKNPSEFKKQKHCPLSFESRISHTTGAYETLCPNNPVERVSFNDVQNYISMLNAKTGMNYRLPTEAEWEYATRAGTKTPYSFGSNPIFLGDYAIYDGNSGDRSHPVGPMRNYANRPNGNGLYDMQGNVYEWTQDFYAESLSGGVDPIGPSGGNYRVIRGGSWGVTSIYLRSADRNNRSPLDRHYDVGFRLVRTLH